MTDALWILAGFCTWVSLCGMDALRGRNRKRLRKAEERVCSMRTSLADANMARERDKSRFAVKLTQAEQEYQDLKDRLEAEVAAERAKNKELRKLLEQKWKEATSNGNP